MYAFTKYEVFTTSRLRANRRPMDGQIDKYLETIEHLSFWNESCLQNGLEIFHILIWRNQGTFEDDMRNKFLFFWPSPVITHDTVVSTGVEQSRNWVMMSSVRDKVVFVQDFFIKSAIPSTTTMKRMQSITTEPWSGGFLLCSSVFFNFSRQTVVVLSASCRVCYFYHKGTVHVFGF